MHDSTNCENYCLVDVYGAAMMGQSSRDNKVRMLIYVLFKGKCNIPLRR